MKNKTLTFCKDCAFYCKSTNNNLCNKTLLNVSDTDFCSFGEDENKNNFDFTKLIPKEPVHEDKNFCCPSCGGWIIWDDAVVPLDSDRYCGRCGQAIDWSNV